MREADALRCPEKIKSPSQRSPKMRALMTCAAVMLTIPPETRGSLISRSSADSSFCISSLMRPLL